MNFLRGIQTISIQIEWVYFFQLYFIPIYFAVQIMIFRQVFYNTNNCSHSNRNGLLSFIGLFNSIANETQNVTSSTS